MLAGMQLGPGSKRGSVGHASVTVSLVIAVTMLASSCASSTDGSAVVPPDAPSQTIDVMQLDVGDYPTRPRAPLGVAGTPEKGAIVEGQRMADYVVGPWEVDQRLLQGGHRPVVSGDGYATSAGVRVPTRDRKGLDPIPWLTPAQSEAISERDTLITGFFSNRKVDSNRLLQNVALRFVDEPAAAAAVVEIGAAIQNDTTLSDQVTPVTIPGYADAVAATYRVGDTSSEAVHLPGFDSSDDVWRYTGVRSVVARGPYVLMQEARSPEGLDSALTMVVKTLDLQGPLIDQFRATAPAELADVQTDPTGLLARTIPVTPEDLWVAQHEVAVFEPRGALHFRGEPVDRAAAMTDGGVDVVANGKDIVYQARDEAAAARVMEAFADLVPDDATPAEPVNALPGSQCFLRASSMAYCVASADRYVVEATLFTLLDAQQLVAAQVAMLLAN